MARIIPKNQLDQITFFDVHGPEWLTAHEELGLTEQQAEAIVAATASARAAYLRAVEARSAAAAATSALENELTKLTTLGGNAIATIKVTARQSDSPASIYTAAGIDPPKRPGYTNVAPPPTGTVVLTPLAGGAGGGVEVRWTSDLSSTGATFYTVRRTFTMKVGEKLRIPTEADTIGVVRGGVFVDTTLPVGFVSVEYVVTPVRQRGGGRNRGTVEGQGGVATYTPGRVVVRDSLAVAAAA